jgi:hypothetical protein
MKHLIVPILLALSLVSCGGPTLAKLPDAPALVATGDKDVRAGAATALGILGSSAMVLDDLSQIELTIRNTIPAAQDAKLRAAIIAAAKQGKAADAQIRAGVTDWKQVKAAVDPFIDTTNQLLAVIRDSGGTVKDKLETIGQVLVSVVLLAAQVYAGGSMPGAFQ